MSSKTLYIIRGVPGSGKSTLAHQLTKNVVETDDFMMVDGEYKYDKDKVYACHKKCYNKVLDYMAHGVTPIAVANTFIKKKDYKPYVDLAKEFEYNVEIKVCKGDYKNVHNVPQDRVEQMKSKFQESINSLLEMNCDTGIETIIENKKKSLFEGYDFESITKLSKTSDGYDITAMGSKIGHIVAEMNSSNQLSISYIEILPEYRQNGIASIALSLLRDELKPTSVIANITSIASLKTFCTVFGNPLYSTNVNGMKVSPSYRLPEYPTETSNTDGEYNTCMWKLSNTIRESVEPKLNDNFKKWFGNSKVVDKNGNPLVVYHGSPNKFEIFDILKTTDNLTYGKGFYFTNDKSAGDEYAGSNGKNYACYIRLINPYIVNSPNMTHEERLKRNRICRNKTDSRTELIKQGYDGILYEEYDELGQYIEVVAFYPNQIKSVNNNGNWSLEVDNINESKEVKFNDNFKKWFGNSKVVDESGQPLVVYHGWNKEFKEFILQDKDVKGVKCAFFSSDINTAASYSEFGNVKDFYLRIENPLIYDANFSQYYIGKDNNHIMVALNKAKKGNYDGVIIKNIRDDSYQEYEEGYEIPYSTTYIVFNPNQIKSVNNNGNWSLEVDNINESKEVKFNDNFKKWFGNSKIVDESGNPMVCYHGTSQEFNEFDKSKRGIHSNGPGAGVGFWFSTSPEYFNHYKNHMEVYLSIQNPKIFKTKPYTRIELQMLWDMYNNEKDSDERYFIYKLLKGVSGREDAYDHFLWDLYSSNNQIPINQNFYGDLRDIVKLKNPEQSYENYINKLKSEGYDGIIIMDTEYDSTYTNGKNNTQIIAFEPNQIKSVKNDNRWDGSSQNIYESFEPKLNDNFKKWFGNSKCVDKNGNPKVFIHRSNAKFNAFDKSKIGQRDHGWYGKGFYFGSAKQKDYKLYGKHVYKCFLRIENPFYYNEFFGSYTPDEMQMIKAYDKLGILTPQESDFLKKYMDAYNHFDFNVKLKKVPQKVKGYNGKVYDSFYWVAQYNGKTTKTDPNKNPDYNTEDYAKKMFWREHYEKYFEKIREINRECYKTRMDKMSNSIRNMGYDGIINADEYVVFEPNQIKSVKNNGNWSLEVDNINEEKEVIEERLFPELSDRKYNELLWFTTPNMTANAYTKFFGKEMIADRIPAKYLVTLSSNDISLKDLVEKHRKLYNAKQVKPIADYKDFNDFITDLNKSKYLSRNDKSNIAKSGAKIIKSFGDWDLYDITTWEAAKKYGSGTTWCVTDSTSDDYFKRYTNRLPFNNYQTEEDMKKSNRSLLFLINPNTDRKMAISVLKRMDYDWYDDEIEFYNEEDEFFYTYSHSSNGSISLKDNIMEKISYTGNDWPDVDVVEDYGVTEDFIMSVTQFIKDTYRMNKEQIVEDINKLRQKYKQLMNIKESANNSTNKSIDKEINEVLKLSGVNLTEGIVDVAKHYPKLDIETIKSLINLDPTYNGGNELGKYGKWILNLYNKFVKDKLAYEKWEEQKKLGNNFPEPVRKSDDKQEDFEKIPNLLKQFNVLNNKLKTNIDKITSISELYKVINDAKTSGLSDNSKVQKGIDLFKKSVEKGGEVVFKNSNWVILVPKTLESSVVFGKDTNWCTTETNGRMYNYYLRKHGGNYFINLDLQTGDLYQFHFESEQFMNSSDAKVKFKNVIQDASVKNFYLDYLYDSVKMDIKPNLKLIINILKINENPSKEIQLMAVQKDGLAIQFIKNPTEEVQMAAVKKDVNAMKYIENPTEEVQLKVVKKNSLYISYIKNPTEKVQMVAVKKNIDALSFIENPTEEVQLMAVQKDEYVIKNIKNPSEKVQLEAVKKNGYVIMLIKNPSEEVQLEAVKKNIDVIEYIKNPTEKVKEYVHMKTNQSTNQSIDEEINEVLKLSGVN